MSTIGSFGTKDPDDVEAKNFDVAPLLARLGLSAADVASVTVTVTEGDGALSITNVAWSAIAKRVSFRWSGGTLDVSYLVTCRVVLNDTRQFDQSGTVTIATH